MSQAPQTHTPAPPAPGSNEAKLGSMAEKLEKLRVEVAGKLDEDQLAVLQAAVVELASLGGHPPGLSQPVPTPASPPPPHQAAPAR